MTTESTQRSLQLVQQFSHDGIGPESVLFSNLLLLGFDPNAYEEKYNLAFHKDMFKNTNIKGMEIIMYFLFSKLDMKRAEKDFQQLFPVSDKKQRTAFRSVALQWLKEMKDRGQIYVLNLQPTLLQSAYGENLYTLLLQVSTHVLKTCFEREYPSYLEKAISKTFFSNFENMTQLQETKAAKNVIMLHIRNQTRKLVQYARLTVEKQERWQELAQNLTNEYKSMNKQEAELEISERNFNSKTDQRLFDDASATDRSNQLDNISTLFKKLELHHEDSTDMRSIINDISNGRDSRMKIFKEDLTKQNQAVHFEKFVNNYHGKSKLNLPLMVDNWTKQLFTLHTLIRHHSTQHTEQVIDKKKQAMSVLGQKDAANLGNYLENESKKQQQYLNAVTSFSKETNQIVDTMETDILKMRKQLDSSSIMTSPKSRFNKFSLTQSTPKKSTQKYTQVLQPNNDDALMEDDIFPVIDEEQAIQQIRKSVREVVEKPQRQQNHVTNDDERECMDDVTTTSNLPSLLDVQPNNSSIMNDSLLSTGKSLHVKHDKYTSSRIPSSTTFTKFVQKQPTDSLLNLNDRPSSSSITNKRLLKERIDSDYTVELEDFETFSKNRSFFK
ncbi:hypothetical protein C9374_013258 [Naegleria lovaniensis]|uniref:HAUS augmin-like complex subunit 6 N-terminal domain-containing protein n=1 Tax=Naegleria lovaniensis TaxID=51637 RepID=A0AA88GVG2_NAELO|nr:uncharacterized protein C9374_013258 [Naegleria lovaniensis]KAG2391773.1 hypothetical protein C9374_013258 [Naegleria lovaniensis]